YGDTIGSPGGAPCNQLAKEAHADKWVEQLIDRDRRMWDESMLERYFFPHDVEEIMKIRLPSREQEDHVLGTMNALVVLQFATEKGNDASSSSTGTVRPIWKMFWKLPVPQKVKVFAWRAILDGLGTQQKKEQRNIVLSNACEIVGMARRITGKACSVPGKAGWKIVKAKNRKGGFRKLQRTRDEKGKVLLTAWKVIFDARCAEEVEALAC
ncbi:hypothetical protein U9M48_011212, partial [Paspalum notatum var. saurae]